MKRTTDCIVIKKRDYKESDKIVTLISKDLGKITAIGKHAKKSIKRNLNLLDFGYLLSVVLNIKEEKNLYFIEQVEIKEKFIDELTYGYFLIISLLNEILNSVVYAQEENCDIFKLIYNFYKRLGSEKNLKNLSYRAKMVPFFFNILKSLGYTVLTGKCICCGKKGDFTNYSLEKAGFLCNKCSKFEKNIQIYKGTVKTINNMDKSLKISEEILTQMEIIFFSTLKNIITDTNFKNIIKLHRLAKDGISNFSM